MDNLHEDLDAFMHSCRTERAKRVIDYMLSVKRTGIITVRIYFLSCYIFRQTHEV
jgi:hypothetical protein